MSPQIERADVLQLLHYLDEAAEILRNIVDENETPTLPTTSPPLTLPEWATNWVHTHMRGERTQIEAHDLADKIVQVLDRVPTMHNPTLSFIHTQLRELFRAGADHNFSQWMNFSNAVDHYLDTLGILYRPENKPRLLAVWRDIARGLHNVHH